MQDGDKKREDPGSVVHIDSDDSKWTGGKLISLGVVTLVIAISIIVSAAAQTGCSVVWVK